LLDACCAVFVVCVNAALFLLCWEEREQESEEKCYLISSFWVAEWDIFEFYADNDSSKKQMHCTLNLWQMMNGTYNETAYADGTSHFSLVLLFLIFLS
jgi:hypothetical protein